MAAEATCSAAQSRGLSLAISARGHGYGDCPKPSPFSPKPHHCPLPAPTPGDAQKSLPLRSSLAGFPFSRRFLLLEVTNTFSSSAREMYCLTCGHFGGEETPNMGCRGWRCCPHPPRGFCSPWPGWLLCAEHQFHLRGGTTRHRAGRAENWPPLGCCPPKTHPGPT